MENEFEIKPKGLEYLPTKKPELKMAEEVNVPEKPGISFGIEQTKDVVKFGVSLANAIITSLKDGKVTITDVGSFIGPLTKIPAAIGGIDQVPYELGDITTVELAELTDIVKDDLEVDDEKAKVICEKSIAVLYQIYDLVKTVKA